MNSCSWLSKQFQVVFGHLVFVHFPLYFSNDAFESPWCLLKQLNIYFLDWLVTSVLTSFDCIVLCFRISYFVNSNRDPLVLGYSFIYNVYTRMFIIMHSYFRSISFLFQLVKPHILLTHLSRVCCLLCNIVFISHILLASHSYSLSLKCFAIWIMTFFNCYNLCI